MCSILVLTEVKCLFISLWQILGLECFPVQREKKKQKAKPHCSLKVIELGGFLGYAIYVELADNLLSRALSLKKMVIDPCAYSGGERKERNDLEKVLVARASAEQLEISLPPGAELVILWSVKFHGQAQMGSMAYKIWAEIIAGVGDRICFAGKRLHFPFDHLLQSINVFLSIVMILSYWKEILLIWK